MKTSRKISRAVLMAACWLSRFHCLPAQAETEIEIPFQRFVLENGLTLVVHEDRKVPIVAVNVWYHVGSKDEPPGRSGFAHLFEHLMFNGSEHSDRDYIQALEEVGATDLNGTTDPDRTNYFQNVPTPALEFALWMESDRMGYLLGAVDQARLEEQRMVVKNEKRQRENRPYGRVHEIIARNTYPAGHPYSWTVLGSMEDLEGASLEDVRDWFRRHYGAANAVIVLAGDIDPQTALRLVDRYFGGIAAGPPVGRQRAWIARGGENRRVLLEEAVPQARLYRVWNCPPWGSEAADHLELVSDLLSRGRASRLYQRLVHAEEMATEVSTTVIQREIGGQFRVQATARPGVSLSRLEAILEEELRSLQEEGPTSNELLRVKAQYRARFLRRAQRVGGFGGKSDLLARGQVYLGDPGHYRTRLERVAGATAEDLRVVARRWLGDGSLLLEVQPASGSIPTLVRSEPSPPPVREGAPHPEFPRLDRFQLSNGLPVVLVRRDSLPLVRLKLLVGAGYATPQGGREGTAAVTVEMLKEGSRESSGLETGRQLDRLGARLEAGVEPEFSWVSLSALAENLGPGLEIFADLVRDPGFRDQDFLRLQGVLAARIAHQKADPREAAFRVFPRVLYGAGHPRGAFGGGFGSEESLARLSLSEVRAFHGAWFHPGNSTLLVVGDTTEVELRPWLEDSLGSWTGRATLRQEAASVPPPSPSRIYLLDRPGASQSFILAGHPAPSPDPAVEAALEVANSILGGTFGSRLKMNLREDKAWSYGVYSRLQEGRSNRALVVSTAVQTDRTAASIREILAEFVSLAGPAPPTAEELGRTRRNRLLRLPGSWETLSEVEEAAQRLLLLGFPDDYYQTYPRRLAELGLPQLRAAASGLVDPARVLLVVVGDRRVLEKELDGLGLGRVRHIDADGVESLP